MGAKKKEKLNFYGKCVNFQRPKDSISPTRYLYVSGIGKRLGTSLQDIVKCFSSFGELDIDYCNKYLVTETTSQSICESKEVGDFDDKNKKDISFSSCKDKDSSADSSVGDVRLFLKSTISKDTDDESHQNSKKDKEMRNNDFVLVSIEG